ncbi:2-octaprenyl-6-methoxyphenyl hydroxylase [Lacimicrobium alkaliphilum]|uniref:2-octaprenyl-6-methoxyphenyl hydroxylase n=1 Tax=Lacimicrobium alkaliphilum TaxID=1526571 RepID=A0ABQ1R014_9ALTE|nr:2-octaprenyl-6-methoxyphenyl hydroxylase [Lacimicrobium alkaliphilum]GGD49819.1 2-octaprenyl-6-methoxyphenyl hydroxylase [Lacimicrobium alkaliphilum]
MKDKQVLEFDLIIAGGGAVGCLLALSLRSCGLKIAIVEASAYACDSQQSLHPGFDARSIALSHQSASYLQQLGLQSSLLENCVPIKQIKVSDQGHLGQCWLDHRQQRVEALGYVTSQQQLGTMLYESVKDADDIDWFCPDSVSDVKQHQQHIDVILSSAKRLSASLLVVAEGGSSPTATKLGFQSQVQDYQQVALVANVKTDHPHEFRAYERFTAQGPLALLPNADSSFGLVWSLAAEHRDTFLHMQNSEFLQQLQQAFGYSVGRFVALSQRNSYPLALARLARTVAHRSVVIGNAAHTLHPIAGQGFNLGLRDAQCLSTLLRNTVKQDGDPGAAPVLQVYSQQRHQDQSLVVNSTDALVRFFSNNHGPLVAGRNLGLGLLDLCGPLKLKLGRAAMGYGGQNAAS